LLSAPAPEALELPGAAGPRLVLDGREFELHLGANSIGRVGADVLLVDSTVSRHHATLTIAEDGGWIEDVGSTNGTFLNGAPVTQGSRSQVQDGDTLKLGSVTVKLVWPEGVKAEAAGRGGSAETGAASAPSVGRAVGRLVAAADGQEHLLRAGVTSLGRRAENDIVVSGDAYVSGRHAEIRCDVGGCVVVDVGSTNGTFLRGSPDDEWERLRPHDPRPLSLGTELRLGQTAFSFQPAPETAEEEPEPNAETDEPSADAGGATGEDVEPPAAAEPEP
jgi:pSer/pThr/pTyr-binding forkhead associated (FHA) protein